MKKLGMMKTILMMGCALALLFAAGSEQPDESDGWNNQ
jgi:hypothetical protein